MSASGSEHPTPREIASEFVRELNAGRRPRIADYVSRGEPPWDLELLGELIAAELGVRLRNGEPARVEQYVVQWPDLASHETLLLDLLMVEYQHRIGREISDAAEYLRRFPDHGAKFRERLEAQDRTAEFATERVSVDGSERNSVVPDRSAADRSAADGEAAEMPEGEPPGQAPASTLRTFGPRTDTSEGNRARRIAAADQGPLPEIDGYDILRVLGRGGMGVVYLGRDRKLNRAVAIKMLRSGQAADDGEVARFQREAEAAAALSHPHIVSVYEVGQSDGRRFFSMEHIDGDTLEDLAESSPFRSGPAAALVQSLADAVDYAHRRGVVHRDLKPDNVLVDRQLRPYITDFGLARRMESEDRLTVTGQVMGTVGYMSPEQARGARDVGPASDIYSLGAVLYRLLTGRPPFAAASLVKALEEIRAQEPPRPRLLNAALDRDVETICLKCLAKRPVDRYATAGELAADLARYLNREPIAARPVGRVTRIVRWCRRKPATAGLLAACALLLAVISLSAWSILRSAEDRAQRRLLAEFDAQLESLEIFQPLDRLDRLIERIAAEDPQAGREAESRAAAALSAAWERRLRQRQRLAPEDVAQLESALQALEQRGASNVSELRERLESRRAAWQTEFDLAAPIRALPDDWGESLEIAGEQLRFKPEDPRLLQSLADAGWTPQRWVSPRASGDFCELEVVFAAGWEKSTELGALLSADRSAGYEFVVVGGEKAGLSGRRLEIRRSGVVLFREPLAAGDGPLRIRARREQNRVGIQVGGDRTFEFDDAFQPATREEPAFGLLWPPNALVAELRGRRRLLPPEASPLETADSLFATGDSRAALREYQALLESSSGASAEELRAELLRAELLHKIGLCQLQLQREAEALDSFQQALQLNAPRWSLRAACQMWQQYVINGDIGGAESVLTSFRGLGFRDAAAVVPAPVRERILDSYQRGAEGIGNLLTYDPDRIRNAERVREVEQHLQVDGRLSEAALFGLYSAYDYAGQSQQALDVLAELMNRSHMVGFYLHNYLRLLRQLGQDDKRAAALQQFSGRVAEEDRQWLMIEAFRYHAGRGEWAEAEKTWDALVAGQSAGDMQGFLPANLMLARGFIRLERQGMPAAREAWRAATPEIRELFRGSKRSGSELVDFLALASLADLLTVEDVELLLARMSGTVMKAALDFERQTIRNVTQAAWNSPRGMALARQLAFDQVSRADRARGCFILLGAQYCLMSAWGDAASPPEEQFVHDMSAELYRRYLETGELSALHLSGLLAIWKDASFTPPVAAWKFLKPALPASLRGPLAYVFAMKFRKNNKPEKSQAFLAEALLEALAAQDKRLLSLLAPE